MINKYQKIKVLLLASVILNLALIGGVITKLTVFSSHNDEGTVHQHADEEHTKSMSEHLLHDKDYEEHTKSMYEHLLHENPEFEQIYDKHRAEFIKHADDLTLLKDKFLNQLIETPVDEKVIVQTLNRINEISKMLDWENYQHLISLKTTLNQKDYLKMITQMKQTLKFTHDSYYHDVER